MERSLLLAPGRGLAVAGPTVIGLVAADPREPRATAFAQQLIDATDASQVSAVLQAHAATGLPELALTVIEGQQLVLFLRGTVQAEISVEGAAPTTLVADNPNWTIHTGPLPSSWALVLPTNLAPSTMGFQHGTSPAGRVEVRLTAAAPPPVPAPTPDPTP
ncbi:MAG: hypothetical protein KDA94_05960, partial [Acidimicrobiales bacterium]|nr:hypothetical protein [Acidimicrobiales bacterium]